MSDEEKPYVKFSEFLSATPTEEESLEFDTAFEIPDFREDLVAKLEKLEAETTTEACEQRKKAYRKQIQDIDYWMYSKSALAPDWLKSKSTPAPELDTEIFEELYIGEPQKKESILGRLVKEASSKTQQAKGPVPSSSKNFFRLEKKVFLISYQGNELTPIPASQPLREIAERLKYPNVPKDFPSFEGYTETGDASQSGKVKNTQNVNDKLSPEGKAAFEKDLKSRFTQRKTAEDEIEKAKAKRISPEGLKGLESALKEQNKNLTQLESYVRKHNGTILDDGSVKWGPCTDKSEISKQKDTFSKNLQRGINQIRENGGEVLAGYLEKYLIKDKYYRPPPGEAEFDVIL